MLVRHWVCWLDGIDAVNVDFLKRKRQRGLIKETLVLDVEEKEVFRRYT